MISKTNISSEYAIFVLNTVTNAFENINQNLFTGLIFLDLHMAFDTVSHYILLSKPDHYGGLLFYCTLMTQTIQLNASCQNFILILPKWRIPISIALNLQQALLTTK